MAGVPWHPQKFWKTSLLYLNHKGTIDFIAEGLGYPHQMRFGAYALYGMQTPEPKNMFAQAQ